MLNRKTPRPKTWAIENVIFVEAPGSPTGARLEYAAYTCAKALAELERLIIGLKPLPGTTPKNVVWLDVRAYSVQKSNNGDSSPALNTASGTFPI